MTTRKIKKVIQAEQLLEGGGFPVNRPFPTADCLQVDPFLMLDHMGPVNWGPGEAIGAPDHPHRGFETVTYMLEGTMQHRDSAGHSGQLGPGDVQWMTAGAGVIHSELPEPEFKRNGGIMNGVQLWVNLPAKDKMMKPRYQEIPADGIPRANSEDDLVSVNVIAGKAMGKSAVIDTRIPITYLHYSIKPGGRIEQALPSGQNALVYLLAGSITIEGQDITHPQMAELEDGNSVILENPADNDATAELLVLAGEPINEPVARGGPFVMNTQEEIRQAFDDYNNGRMGRISD